MMKKAGLVVDNYKVAKFEQELKRAGFFDVEVSPRVGHPKLSVITVMFHEADINKLNTVFTRTANYFKASKN